MNSRETYDSQTHANGQEGSQGWDAIDRALQTVYGDQQPAHFGTLIKFRLGEKSRWTASASIAASRARRTGTMSAMASAICMAIWTTATTSLQASPVAMVSS
jgi:hypothetical protein